MIECYASEFKKIKFINLSPGLIKTRMQKQICKIDDKKIKSVKKFKKLNYQNKVPSPEDVAINVIKNLTKFKKIPSGSYIDIPKKLKFPLYCSNNERYYVQKMNNKKFNKDYFEVLRKIEKKPSQSQREMANDLGFSLGKLNYCLKALKTKGLVKINNFKKP